MMIRTSHFGIWKKLAILLVSFLWVLIYSCTTDREATYIDIAIDTDGDGILDAQEVVDGTDKNDPCDPSQDANYTSYDASNLIWQSADCDSDGINNADEIADSSNPYFDESLDTDGDGIADSQEILQGSDKDDPCDPFQSSGYIAFDAQNAMWLAADCDGDGTTNGDEIANETDPYFDEIGGIDTDGDGIKDARETIDGTDLNDPCDPIQTPGYAGYDAGNATWTAADCDSDGITNGDEVAMETDPYDDNAMYAIPEFLPTLSELQLFDGALADLVFIPNVHEYEVSTGLFADYAYKLRSVALPQGEQMSYNGEGLFLFPDNTILTETIYYLNDERNPSLGKKIIETRILINMNGIWEMGRYVWNDAQTEAFLDDNANAVPVSWIDNQGNSRNVNYLIPPKQLCIQCHDLNGSAVPIGIKARALNFIIQGSNQLQDFIDNGIVTGAPDVSQIPVLPGWTNTTFSVEDRARAYLDVNCAHCHQPGGSYNTTYGDTFDLRYETSFEDSNIFEVRVAIQNRMNSLIPNYFMPFIGTTVIHEEGVALVNTYIDSLD